MARSSNLSRRDGGRYYLQLRLRTFTPGLPSRLVRFSLATSDYSEARRILAERMAWLLPLQMSRSPHQRYLEIKGQLEAFNAQGPVTHRSKLASRINFEHVVRRLIDELGGLKDDGAFNENWMSFCRENLAAETRIATDDRLAAYEQGRRDALRASAMSVPSGFETVADRPAAFDPTRPERGIVVVGQGNGQDTAVDDIAVILARVKASQPRNDSSSQRIENREADSVLIANATGMPRLAKSVAAISSTPDDKKVLSQFLEEYLATRRKRDGDDRARSEIGPIVSFAIALLGDKHPNSYTRAEYAHLNAEIPSIPTRKNIPSNVGRDLFARYQYARANPSANLVATTEATIRKNYHSGLDRLYNWLIKQGITSRGPVLDLVTPSNRTSLPRDSFDDDEVLRLLRLPLFTGCHSRARCWTPGSVLVQGSLYWQYLILLLTGMRPGEVGPLKTDDLIVSDGFACFDLRPFDARKGRVSRSEIRTLKTGASARIVPIHPLLIELGLIDHRDEMVKHKQTMLLPDCEPYRKPDGQLRWSQQITKSWQYVRRKLKVVDREDVTLYSTRHTMADMIDQLMLSSRTRDRVLGHANSATSAGNYGRNGLLSAKELQAFSGIENDLIDRMRDILLPPKRDADAGRLTLIRPTR